jgi:exonuclease SbcC
MVYLELVENRNKVLETVKRLSDEYVAVKTALEALKVRYMQMETLILEKAKVDKELAQVNDLEKLFQGKRFVSYMATHRLQYISGKASEQLFDISLGNFGLETDEEGNFAIRDYKNGGALRDPSSLSGGETFMVSLALALALSAQIQLKGTAPLEFFFLDEGFGTLDEDTLEVVMSALERLHHERLSIGLISHVESIKNRVPIKLIVSPAKAGLGGSRVQVELS